MKQVAHTTTAMAYLISAIEIDLSGYTAGKTIDDVF